MMQVKALIAQRQIITKQIETNLAVSDPGDQIAKK
jgi:hypothetical protein